MSDTPGPELRSQARLAAIVESSDDAIISKDLNGIILTWNRGAERIFGYRSDEAVGQSITLLFPPERQNEEPAILERIRRGERVDHYETVRRCKDGKLIDISLTVSPIVDEHGTVIGASKVARDITQRKQAAAQIEFDQEALSRLYAIGQRSARAGEPLLEHLSALLDTAIWISRADKGNVQLYDPDAQVLRIVVQQGFDAPFLEFFATVDAKDDSACGAALASNERVIVEDVTKSELFCGQPSLSVVLQAGVRAIQSTPLISSTGTILGMVSTHFEEPHHPSAEECRWLDVMARQIADYLERKRFEEQREELLQIAERARKEAQLANRAKDEFLAMLSHELRTPLNAILGWTQILQGAPASETETLRRGLEVIERNTRLQATLVSDLLDMSRILSGKLQLEIHGVDLISVIESAIETMQASAHAKQIRIERNLDSRCGPVAGDPARLQQVICNVLSNAIKFTPAGGRVRVCLQQSEAQAQISVTDTGVGIRPEFLPSLFERFHQGDASTSRKHGGLGLGLAIAKQIAELHGGTVSAASEGEGRGSTFVIRLPAGTLGTAEPSQLLRRAAPAPADRKPEISLSGLGILLVEDEPDARELLRRFLEERGAHVRAVSSASDALALLGAFHPDLLVSDIGMPEMDGYEVIRRIRKLPPSEGGSIPALAVTAFARSEDRTRVLRAGYQAHVTKPVDPSELIATVAALCKTAPSRSRQ